MPVANYGAELLEVFRIANQKKVIIKLPSHKAAVRLRFRLHNLRKDMRREQHHMLALAEGVSFHIQDRDEGGADLLASPADEDFKDALVKAGVEITIPDELQETPGDAVSAIFGVGSKKPEEKE